MYYNKYLKYKNKYLKLQSLLLGGNKCNIPDEKKIAAEYEYTDDHRARKYSREMICKAAGYCWEKKRDGIPYCYKPNEQLLAVESKKPYKLLNISDNRTKIPDYKLDLITLPTKIKNITSKKHYFMYKINKEYLTNKLTELIIDKTHITLATFSIISYKTIQEHNIIENTISTYINSNKNQIHDDIKKLYNKIFNNFFLTYTANTILEGNNKRFFVCEYEPIEPLQLQIFENLLIMQIIKHFALMKDYIIIKSASFLNDQKSRELLNLSDVPNNCNQLLVYGFKNKKTFDIFDIIFYLYKAKSFHISLTSIEKNFDMFKKIKYNNINNFMNDVSELYYT